jgi:uncharacterized protein (TIGR00369 family)
MASMAEDLDAMRRGQRPLPGFDRTLGFKLVELDEGRAVFETEADERHHNPGDRLHGGFLTGLADSAMGFAFGTTTRPGESATNVEVKIHFLRPFWRGRLRAEARVVHRGRTVGMAEADVTDDQGRLVARAASTFLVLPADAAAETAGRH